MNLVAFLRKRLLQILPVLFGIALVVFLVVRLIPGDPARIMLGTHASEERLTALRDQLGLNLPIWDQFLRFLGNLLQGELGTSLFFRRDVMAVILERLPPTIFLVTFAVLLSIAICLPLAIWAALREGRWPDQLVRIVSTLTLAMPGFWVGLNLLILFGVIFPIFPISGYGTAFLDRLHLLFLPALPIALSLAPILTRTLRPSGPWRMAFSSRLRRTRSSSPGRPSTTPACPSIKIGIWRAAASASTHFFATSSAAVTSIRSSGRASSSDRRASVNSSSASPIRRLVACSASSMAARYSSALRGRRNACDSSPYSMVKGERSSCAACATNAWWLDSSADRRAIM